MVDQPRIREGAPVPLFDRLVDNESRQPAEPRPFRVMGPAELRQSVRREIARILDTRRAIGPEDALLEAELTVLEYGVADISNLSPGSLDDRQLMGLLITKAIRAFEPRLTNCSVQVERVNQQDVKVQISGVLKVGTIVEPLSFPVVLSVKAMDRVGTDAAD